MKTYSVIWSKQAHKSIKDIHSFIAQDSSKGAAIVVNKIFKTGTALKHFPNGHPIDIRLHGLSFSYRVVSIWSYQIIFTVDEDNHRVIIVQVFDARQNPSKLKV